LDAPRCFIWFYGRPDRNRRQISTRIKLIVVFDIQKWLDRCGHWGVLTPASIDARRVELSWVDRFSRFCTAHGRASLYFTMGRPFPSKLSLPVRRAGYPSNTWFLGPIRASNYKRHLDRFSRFCRLNIVIHRRTDHATRCVTIGRIYARNMRCGLIITINAV